VTASATSSVPSSRCLGILTTDCDSGGQSNAKEVVKSHLSNFVQRCIYSTRLWKTVRVETSESSWFLASEATREFASLYSQRHITSVSKSILPLLLLTVFYHATQRRSKNRMIFGFIRLEVLYKSLHQHLLSAALGSEYPGNSNTSKWFGRGSRPHFILGLNTAD